MCIENEIKGLVQHCINSVKLNLFCRAQALCEVQIST